MALADVPSAERVRCLDSWKEIAAYLRRDVRTATRWESQGLPIHRVAGGKGRSVFAFTQEIDAWMAGNPAGIEPTAQTEPLAAKPARRPLRALIIGAACVLAATSVVGAVMLFGAPPPLDLASLQVTATATQVSIADASGASRVIHRFDPGARLVARPARVDDFDADGRPEILTTVSHYDNQPEAPNRPGEILNLSIAGDVRWRFAFDDEVPFAGRSASGPWAITDWQVGQTAGPARIVVAAHEPTWWASIVALLDHRGLRLNTFVNPGWVESVLWLSSDRIAIAGFNNMRGEAMFAMLDVNRMDGQAPGSDGTAFACLTCPSGVPPFYATFARSELNLLTAGGFNRAQVATFGDQLRVTTTEIQRDRSDATALYEFDRDLRFVRARYSDSYWDEHVRLELEGRLAHSREACPERDGPKAIHAWDAARGWVSRLPTGGR